MRNVSTDYRETLFMDLDGTLVMWNADPEVVADVVIASTAAFVRLVRENTYLVITTGRDPLHTQLALNVLRGVGIVPDAVLSKLPIGKRIVVNDYKPGQEYKALAINVERNAGLP